MNEKTAGKIIENPPYLEGLEVEQRAVLPQSRFA